VVLGEDVTEVRIGDQVEVMQLGWVQR
jgi:hypothetical protein